MAVQKPQIAPSEIADLLHRVETQKAELSPIIQRYLSKLKPRLVRALEQTEERDLTDQVPEATLSCDFPRLFENFCLESSSRRAYRNGFNRLQKWCTEKNIPINQMNHSNFLGYLHDLRLEMTEHTVCFYIRSIFKFYAWLRKTGILNYNPVPEVKDPIRNNETRAKKLYSTKEIKILFDAFDTDNINDLRDRAMVGLMLYACVPILYITEFKIEDFVKAEDRRHMRIFVADTEHRIPLHDVAAKLIEEYIEKAKIGKTAKDLLFPSFGYNRKGNKLSERALCGNLFKKWRDRTGIHISYTRLRQTGLSALLQAIPDIDDAKRVMPVVGITSFYKYKAVAHLAPNLFDTADHPGIAKPLLDFVEKSGIFNLSGKEQKEQKDENTLKT